MNHHVQNEAYTAALEALRKQNDISLYYKFSPVLMQVSRLIYCQIPAHKCGLRVKLRKRLYLFQAHTNSNCGFVDWFERQNWSETFNPISHQLHSGFDESCLFRIKPFRVWIFSICGFFLQNCTMNWQSGHREQWMEAVRYLEYCTTDLHCTDPAIHNYLLSLYVKYQPESVTKYAKKEKLSFCS